jgi:anaerobic selenocysteine-containing dehydrogenase
MFNYVRLSTGGARRMQEARSEVEVIAGIARATLPPDGPIDWQAMENHGTIRRLIAQIIPEYEAIKDMDSSKREFHLPGRILHRPVFSRPGGKGLFAAHSLPVRTLGADELQLMSVRSEGQFNTVVYEEEDRYRGQERRDVILMNSEDMKARGIGNNDRVRVSSAIGSMAPIIARDFAIRQGCALMYYPEVNVLISREVDPHSRTPAFKDTAIRVERMVL